MAASYFPKSDIIAALRGSDSAEMVPVQGVVLFCGRPRPIFLSDTTPECRRRMLAFFANSRRRYLAGALALRAGRVPAGMLSRVELPLPSAWQGRFQRDLVPLALYCGSPGPLQKLTLLFPGTGEGGPGVVVKVSLRSTADDVVGNESAVIGGFTSLSDGLRASLPQVVDRGQLPSGRRFLATVASAGRVVPADRFEPFADFLCELGRATRADFPWADSPAMALTRAALRRARRQTMTDDVHDLLSRALDQVDRQLRTATVPHVLAHGDFTRFNIRGNGDRFSVFDWEYARPDANPMTDVTHFHLSQPGAWSPLTIMHHTLASAEHMLAGAYEGWAPSTRDLAALTLHSLVDTMTFYSNAGAALDLESFVVRRYLGLIEACSQWGLE